MSGFQGLGGTANADGFLSGGGGAIPINDAYPYSDLWIPAIKFALNGTEQPSRNSVQIGVQPKTESVITFDPNVQQSATYNFLMKRNKLSIATPAFRYVPVFIQDAEVGDPAGNVVWNANLRNANLVTTLDNSGGTGTDLVSSVRAQYILSGSDLAEALAVQGDALSATLLNFLQFRIIRRGNQVADNYLNPVHLLGVGIQFCNDFGNVTQWPLVPPS